MIFILACIGWMLANHLKNLPVFDRAETMVIVALVIQILTMVIR